MLLSSYASQNIIVIINNDVAIEKIITTSCPVVLEWNNDWIMHLCALLCLSVASSQTMSSGYCSRRQCIRIHMLPVFKTISWNAIVCDVLMSYCVIGTVDCGHEIMSVSTAILVQ